MMLSSDKFRELLKKKFPDVANLIIKDYDIQVGGDMSLFFALLADIITDLPEFEKFVNENYRQ